MRQSITVFIMLFILTVLSACSKVDAVCVDKVGTVVYKGQAKLRSYSANHVILRDESGVDTMIMGATCTMREIE